VWGGKPPIAARTTLHSYIYRLRRLLIPIPDAELLTYSSGYALRVDPQQIDLGAFRAKVAAARIRSRAGDTAGAIAGFRDALALWRGRALAGIPGDYLGQEARLLEGERLAAADELYAGEIALGNHRDIVPDLQKLTAAYPFHEGLQAQLILALYRAGRQAEALQTYSLIRRRLRDELGIEPGHELRALHRSVLGQVPAGEIELPQPAGRQARPITTPTRS
jgi:DNA-binding SARP family transcriptional activator